MTANVSFSVLVKNIYIFGPSSIFVTSVVQLNNHQHIKLRMFDNFVVVIPSFFPPRISQRDPSKRTC